MQMAPEFGQAPAQIVDAGLRQDGLQQRAGQLL
jgi:hypothetical protein